MAKLIYSAITSADGYVEDAAGRFDWAAPGEELLCFVNDLERPVRTYLYGRRMYETMLYWETAHTVRRPAAFRPGVHQHLAGSRQDRVLKDTRISVERQNTDRTDLRSRHGPAPEVGHRARPDCRGCRPGRAGHHGRAGRRTAAAPGSRHRRRWQASAPQQCPLGSGTAGHPAVRKRCCLPQVPSQVSVITSRVSQADHCARIGHPTVTPPSASQTQLMLRCGCPRRSPRSV